MPFLVDKSSVFETGADAPSFIAPQPVQHWLGDSTRPLVSRRRPRSRSGCLVAVANPSSSIRKAVKNSKSRESPASASSAANASAGGALERESATDRFVDLRTLKKGGWHDVRVAATTAPGCRFGPFSSASAVAALDDDVLFGPDTVALSEPQRTAVRALLSRRSVLYSSTLPDREALVLDLCSRAREWGQTIVYCAPTVRAAEAMFTIMCSFNGGEKQVLLDIGYEVAGNANTPPSRPCPSLIVTVPRVLRRAIVSSESHWWMSEADLYVLDDLLMPGVPEWEEIILGMPSRALLCVLATELTPYELDEFPLWLETVQNCVVPIMRQGSVRFSDRIDRAIDAPLARAFIYNAARHQYPVQMSLPLVAEELRKEFATSATSRVSFGGLSSTPGSSAKGRKRTVHPSMRNVNDIVSTEGAGEFANALLRGVQILSADDIADLVFDSESEAQFADFVSVVVADARQAAEKISEKAKRSRRKVTKRRKTAAVLQAASNRRRRREEASLLPALLLAHGQGEAEFAANAIVSCLREDSVELCYDSDAEEILSSILDDFTEEHESELSTHDLRIVSSLRQGVGVIHGALLPVLRSLAEELFRDGLVAVLCVDTYLGPRELAALPNGRSVLVQSSTLAEESDASLGIVKGSLVGNLAGRPGFDDVGNVIALWFDEEVDDAEASGLFTAALFGGEVSFTSTQFGGGERPGLPSVGPGTGSWLQGSLPSASQAVSDVASAQRRSGEFLMNYRGLLGAMRRYGFEGYGNMADYALDSYRSWMIGAGLRATREKVEVEKRAVDEHLTGVKWDELAAHDRLEAALNEQSRLYRAMVAKKDSVLAERIFSDLKATAAGSLIGLRDGSGERLLSASPSGGNESEESAGSDEEKTVAIEEESHSRDASGSKIVPAIFVRLVDESVGRRQASTIKGTALVVCVLVDGMWTLAPVGDVVAIADQRDPVENVDLVQIPHLATFDKDPVTKWGKCKPISESEVLQLNCLAEELVGDLSTKAQLAAGLSPRKLSEFDKQEMRLQSAKKAYEASPWAGRDGEMGDLRRLRSRALELGEDAQSLRSSEDRLEDNMGRSRSDLDGRIRRMLAVLEDCNAVSVPGDDALDMTPIGSVASLLPGPFPVFAAACLLLVSGLGELSPAQLAAFVSVLISPPRVVLKRSMDDYDENSDDFYEHIRGHSENHEGFVRESLELLLAPHVVHEMEQIRSALHVVQRRHFDAESSVKAGPRLAPDSLTGRAAEAVFKFVDGACPWSKLVEESRVPSGQLVADFRLCAETLRVLRHDSAGLGELEDLQPSVDVAIEALSVWPMSEADDLVRLAKSGISGQRRKTTSYKAWWDRARADVEIAIEEAESASVPIAEVEVVDTGDSDSNE